MELARRSAGRTDADAPAASHRGGLLVFGRVILILALWVCGFVAFLVAPLIVLLVAWIVGMAFLAARHRGSGHGSTSAAPAAPHRFGTRRTIAPAGAAVATPSSTTTPEGGAR